MPSPNSSSRLRPHLSVTSFSPGLLPVTLLLVCGPAVALDRTWIGGNVDWADGGAATNWTPNDEPDTDDTAIFNTANTVNLASNNTVIGLTLSSSIDLLTNDFDLTVDGLVQLANASTNLVVGGATSLLSADDLTINSGATLELTGGSVTVAEETGTCLLDMNAGGNLFGNGTVTIGDVPVAVTTQWINDGTITALSRSAFIFGAPPVGTLALNDSSTTTRIDLDGSGEAGVVNVNRNQTLDLNIPLSDAFNGDLNLFHNTVFDSSSAWTMAGGTLDVSNGFVDSGGLGLDIPAGTATIEGGNFTLSGGTLSVGPVDGTLRFDTNVTISGGTLSNTGKTVFNGTTTVTSAASLSPVISASQIEISGAMTITDAAGNFNWDGPGTATTTVLGTGTLDITANQVDTGDNVYGGNLNLNDNADLSVNVAATEWTLAGVLTKNNAGTSTVSGDRILATGNISVPAGTLDLPAVTAQVTSNINVAGTLTLGGASVLAGPNSVTGSGLLRMEGVSSVTANTTILTSTFDWDGLGTGTSHTIADGVTFTINSAVLDSDGDMDDPVNLGGNGSSLIVNGPVQWTQNGVVNANNLAAGTATIGGTSDVTFTNTVNVNGNTTVATPATLNGASFFADIDAGMTLDLLSSATYVQGLIDGAGTFNPGSTNNVTGNFTINADTFDFDNGSWTVASGIQLSVSTVDYDTTATNAHDGTITLNSGDVSFVSGDAEFVMDGVLNMNHTGGGNPGWNGEPIDIGNDAGALDGDLNVGGTGNSEFGAPVDFNSDADVSIAAGATLRFLTNSTVNFDTVNAANNAEFTGPGGMVFNGGVNVNEAVTLNLTGGSVDLDGSDDIGEFLNIDAPLTIQAASLLNFGRVNGGGGTNTLDINNSVGTGVLTVVLDEPAAEWTLNGAGVMNLVNDNTEAILLSGNPVNINGTVNVTGDVISTARLDIAGVININTAGQPLRFGGGTGANPNTLQGGTIGGTGVLSADTGTALSGFGTINTGISFIGTAALRADNGTLTLNQPIVDVGQVGTVDADGTLNVVNAWNNNVTTGVQIRGGILAGGTITNDVTAGISGHGLVTARVINNTQLFASLGDSLIFQTAANDNDWDGTTNTGLIYATSANIELRDTATFAFTGTVSASNAHTVFANGFALDFNPGSSLLLSNGTYHSTSSTDLGGTVTVGGASPSTIQVQNNFFLTFETGSTTTLNRDLQLLNNNIIIEAGATFSGSGAIVVPDGSHMVMDAGANANVLLNLAGALRPNNSQGIGRVDVLDFQEAPTAELYHEIIGTALNQYDRIVVNGTAVIDGYLNLDIDEVSPGVQFVPTLGQTFNIISASGGVTGTFDAVETSGMPAGLTFKVNYLPNFVQVEVIAGSEFETWIHLFPSITNPSDRLKTADPDHDGLNNLMEFAFDGNPASGANDGKVVTKIAPVAGVNALTLTFPVRYKNEFSDNASPDFRVIGLTTPTLRYRVFASDDLITFPLTVGLVTGADATAIQAGLPQLSTSWEYTTLRSPGPVAGDPKEFMRVDISEGPLSP